MVVIGLIFIFWKTYRMAKDAFDSYEHLYTQFAILDSAYNQIQNQYEGLKEQHFTDVTDVSILDGLVDKHVNEIQALGDFGDKLQKAQARWKWFLTLVNSSITGWYSLGDTPHFVPFNRKIVAICSMLNVPTW